MDNAYTILVVDDAPDVVTILSFHLRRAGYCVVGVCSGAEAIDTVRAGPIDLAVTDLAMPGITGVDVIAAIKGTPATRHVPVLVVSGNSDGAIADQALAAGADAIMSKPVRGQDLVRQVRRLLCPAPTAGMPTEAAAVAP